MNRAKLHRKRLEKMAAHVDASQLEQTGLGGRSAVYSTAHLQRPAEPSVLHDRALIDARYPAERAVGQPMATVGRRQVC